MKDDAVREHHGVSGRSVSDDSITVIRAHETAATNYVLLHISKSDGIRLTSWQARYLASKLYRLSRRINNRVQHEEEMKND